MAVAVRFVIFATHKLKGETETIAEFFESYAIWAIWIIFGLAFLVFLAMAPCHAVFVLPFVGLPLFWLLPLGYALPINSVIWLASPFLYRVISRAMKKPIQDGFQSLIGTEAEVVSRLASDGASKFLVRSQGELWSAYATDVLEIGETVKIIALRGVGVVVAPVNSQAGKDDNAKTVISGNRDSGQHCH